MKLNKKLTVVSLSTVLGLGLVGSITGAIAWFQYSTRTTTSIVGTATGNGGNLQISTKGTNWARDLHSTELMPASGFTGFKPITFGGFDWSGDSNALPEKAYMSPNAGEADMTKWQEATKGVDYIQYTVYLQSLKLNNSTHQYEKNDDKIYLTNITLEDVNDTTRENESIINSLRIHVLVENAQKVGDAAETTSFIKQDVISVEDFATTGLATSGNLDLDGDGAADKKGGYEWQDGYDSTLTYGVADSSLKSKAASSLVAGTDANGNILAADASKNYLTALKDNTEVSGAKNLLKLTFTIWSEGWEQFTDNTIKPMWDPSKREGVQFHVGFTFDVGTDAYRA